MGDYLRRMKAKFGPAAATTATAVGDHLKSSFFEPQSRGTSVIRRRRGASVRLSAYPKAV
jgi:hypothetical protein